MVRIGRIIPWAWGVYVLFLFMPAARGVDISRAGFETVAIELAAPFDDAWWPQSQCVLFCLVGVSHLVMVISPLALFTSWRSVEVGCIAALLAATIIQFYMVWWLCSFNMLEVGSYLSATAFFLLTLGFYLRSRTGGLTLGQLVDHAV